MSNHFADEDWADFVRGKAEAERRSSMERHLGEGCGECQGLLRIWSTVNELGGREASSDPPDWAVRQVLGQFALLKPRRGLRRSATLEFDSARAPLPSGVRAGRRVARELLYSSRRQFVKLRIESQSEPRRLLLVGQLVDKKDPGREQPARAVLVRAGRRVLARAVTNRHGEFEVECEPAAGLRLSVGAAGRGELALRLPKEQQPGRERRGQGKRSKDSRRVGR
ncbi:MAG: hypothetical protein AB7O37_08755 [Vicinamibacteria bacterium]